MSNHCKFFLPRFKEIALFLNKTDIFDIEVFKLIEACRYINTCTFTYIIKCKRNSLICKTRKAIGLISFVLL